MNLFDTISDEIKKAMLSRDKVRLEALRGDAVEVCIIDGGAKARGEKRIFGSQNSQRCIR